MGWGMLGLIPAWGDGQARGKENAAKQQEEEKLLEGTVPGSNGSSMVPTLHRGGQEENGEQDPAGFTRTVSCLIPRRGGCEMRPDARLQRRGRKSARAPARKGSCWSVCKGTKQFRR